MSSLWLISALLWNLYESVRRICYYCLCFCLLCSPTLPSLALWPSSHTWITATASWLVSRTLIFWEGGWGNGVNHVGQHGSGFGGWWVVQFQDSNGFIAGNGRQVWKEISTVEKVLDLHSKFRWFGGHRGDFFFFNFWASEVGKQFYFCF